MRLPVTPLHYFVPETDSLFNTAQRCLRITVWAQLRPTPIQFLIFNYGHCQIKLLNYQREIQSFWTWNVSLLHINSGLIIYCIVICISCYQLWFIYCMQWYVQFIILSAIDGCFVIWIVWIVARKMTKTYAVIETKRFLWGLSDKLL